MKPSETKVTAYGRIIKIISNLYSVEVKGTVYECWARGKFRLDNITPLVGDYVLIDTIDKYIIEIKERKNTLSRPPIANVDACLIVASTKEPTLSLNLLDKELLVVSNANIKPYIVLSKVDLLSKKEKKEIKKIFTYYKSLGYKVFTNRHKFSLRRALKNKVVVLVGQTGAGKSSLLNRLDKNLNLDANPISKHLGRGIHTTRHVELYKIGKTYFADTPGFSALDLHMSKNTLETLYPEFNKSTCKFPDCTHTSEVGCSIIPLVEEGKIMQSRYENYLKFRGEIK